MIVTTRGMVTGGDGPDEIGLVTNYGVGVDLDLFLGHCLSLYCGIACMCHLIAYIDTLSKRE